MIVRTTNVERCQVDNFSFDRLLSFVSSSWTAAAHDCQGVLHLSRRASMVGIRPEVLRETSTCSSRPVSRSEGAIGQASSSATPVVYGKSAIVREGALSSHDRRTARRRSGFVEEGKQYQRTASRRRYSTTNRTELIRSLKVIVGLLVARKWGVHETCPICLLVPCTCERIIGVTTHDSC